MNNDEDRCPNCPTLSAEHDDVGCKNQVVTSAPVSPLRCWTLVTRADATADTEMSPRDTPPHLHTRIRISVRTKHQTINVMWHFKHTKAPSDPRGEMTDYEADCDHCPFSPPVHMSPGWWRCSPCSMTRSTLSRRIFKQFCLIRYIMKCRYSKNVIISWNVKFSISCPVTAVLYLIYFQFLIL